MDANSRVDAVFARATDFEIVDGAQKAIEQLYGFETILERNPRVPYDRWVVHTIGGNTGFFETNGYSYFWGTNCDHKGFAECLRVIGRPILATVIEEAIAAVPARMLGNWDAVDEFFRTEKKRIAAAETMDVKLISEDPGIMDKASKYIRSHRSSYSDLIEAIDANTTNWREITKEYEQ